LRDEPVTLIAGIGRDQDPARLGPQPPHMHLERYVPQTLLLPHCAAFITHGGFNSVKEAMSFGILMVIIPMMGDQVYCAARCRALGMAEVVELEERTTDRIREAVRAIVSTPSYRRAAQAMRRQMEALSNLNEAILLLIATPFMERTSSGELSTWAFASSSLPRAPWQNPFAERVIGSIRRECLDLVIVLNERHLRHVLRGYLAYYNVTRPRQSLANDSPRRRQVQPPSSGRILAVPEAGGFHHRYHRAA
jgi:hypothetical protein